MQNVRLMPQAASRAARPSTTCAQASGPNNPSAGLPRLTPNPVSADWQFNQPSRSEFLSSPSLDKGLEMLAQLLLLTRHPHRSRKRFMTHKPNRRRQPPRPGSLAAQADVLTGFEGVPNNFSTTFAVELHVQLQRIGLVSLLPRSGLPAATTTTARR